MGQFENIVVDAETFYDVGYSLTQIATSEYIRDSKFETHGISFIRESEGYKPRFVRAHELRAYLATIDWSKVRMIAHNGHFDFAIMAWVFGVIAGQYFCTMAASRYINRGKTRHGVEALAKHFHLRGKLDGLEDLKGRRCATFTEDEWVKLAEYAIHDARLELFYFLEFFPHIPESELRLMDDTFREWCDPVLNVDIPLAKEALKDAQEQRANKITAGGVDMTVLNSREKFANLLCSMGIDPPMKISKSTGKPTYAFARTDESFLELLEHSDEEVRLVVEAKMESSSNIQATRAERLIKMGETGPLALALNVWGADTTLRDSAGNKMNIQNFVRGSKLRRSIRAPKDYVLMPTDLSQIELRMNAWFCGQEDLLETLRRGEDAYDKIATDIYKRPIRRKAELILPDGTKTCPDELEGQVGKVSALQLQYNSGAKRLQHALATDKKAPIKLPLAECQMITDGYRQSMYMIAASWEMGREWLKFLCHGSGTIQYKCITLDADKHKIYGPDGTFLYYPGLSEDAGVFTYIRAGGAEIVYIYGGKLIQNIIQWLSRGVMISKWHLLRDRYRIPFRVHDELIPLVPASEAEAAKAWVKQVMRTPIPWAPDLPLDASVSYNTFYDK